MTWSTINNTKEASLVEYGIIKSDVSQTATGIATEFIDGGLAKRVQFIHRVTLTGLLPKQKYCNNFHLASNTLSYTIFFLHMYLQFIDVEVSLDGLACTILSPLTVRQIGLQD